MFDRTLSVHRRLTWATLVLAVIAVLVSAACSRGETPRSNPSPSATPLNGLSPPASIPAGSDGNPASPTEQTLSSAAGSKQDPIPQGEAASLRGVWDLAVSSVDFDAADDVLGYVDINPPPETGFRYVMVSLEGAYRGDGIAQPAFYWLVTDGRDRYRPSIPGCGVIPNSIYDITQLQTGEAFMANLCIPVKAESVRRGLSLKLHVDDDDPFYFDLA